MKILPYKNYEGVYTYFTEENHEKIATKNLVLGQRVYGERVIAQDGAEYRTWDPKRSKLAAAVLRDMKPWLFKPGMKVLYLGAASGTTPSHISDIIGANGTIYCLEFSPRVCRELVAVSELRSNMIPLLADVRFPESYSMLIENVDLIYSDVAQPEQSKIISSNARWFLKPLEWIILCVKSRSVDVTKKPSEIYKKQIEILKQDQFQIEEIINLDPFSGDHAMILARSEL